MADIVWQQFIRLSKNAKTTPERGQDALVAADLVGINCATKLCAGLSQFAYVNFGVVSA